MFVEPRLPFAIPGYPRVCSRPFCRLRLSQCPAQVSFQVDIVHTSKIFHTPAEYSQTICGKFSNTIQLSRVLPVIAEKAHGHFMNGFAPLCLKPQRMNQIAKWTLLTLSILPMCVRCLQEFGWGWKLVDHQGNACRDGCAPRGPAAQQAAEQVLPWIAVIFLEQTYRRSDDGPNGHPSFAILLPSLTWLLTFQIHHRSPPPGHGQVLPQGWITDQLAMGSVHRFHHTQVFDLQMAQHLQHTLTWEPRKVWDEIGDHDSADSMDATRKLGWPRPADFLHRVNSSLVLGERARKRGFASREDTHTRRGYTTKYCGFLEGVRL